MSELREIYETAGGDFEKALSRLGGNEEMLKRFLRLFAKDVTFEELRKKLSEDKTEEAFRAAHTLKGMCANLGFDGMYESASELTELLRSGELDKAKIFFLDVEALYGNTIEVMKRYLG